VFHSLLARPTARSITHGVRSSALLLSGGATTAALHSSKMSSDGHGRHCQLSSVCPTLLIFLHPLMA
ncbi:MAG TPA: hypothetical protein VGJ87_12660, partial [Roseiflexaceae bacterium]